ncbi:MAG: hypothetical protein JNL68_14325 [Burkholderiales bacterium]|nr:hypothetical protein [Burkholderiales bacterium]
MIKLICSAAGLALLIGCQRAPQAPPSVIGIPFAVPVSAIKQHLPEGGKAEQYPLIPMYGYKLRYANPENWEVIVQDESADELAESRIYAIYLGRMLGRACTRSDTEAVVNDLQKKNAATFSTTVVHNLKEEEAVAFLAVDERRMLSATASCFIQKLSVRLTYLDLDRYQYRKPEEVQAILKKAATEAKEYKTRVLK